jgi:ferric-dicitrate binding protein FerR (iron transport regulator)
VSEHVAPHRWADLWAGRVDEAERVTMERHVERCRACARVRQRVTRASDSFAAIRTQPPPEVPWDAIRAKVHWSVSTERQAALRRRQPAYGWLAAAAAAGVAIGLAANAWDPAGIRTPAPATAALPDREASVAPRSEPARPPAPLIGLVSRASGDVMVDGVRPDDLFARRLTEGSSLATGDGRVDVQFGSDSAFALGAMSTLRLRRFDARTIELAVDGTLDVAVAPRAGGQRFLVDAGDQLVEVRGTQFRVVHDAGGTRVACRHGVVTVSDRTGAVELAAEQRLAVAAGRSVAGERPMALSADEAAAFDHAPPLSLPLWDPAALPRSSAPLEIATAGRRDVRVDGIELGLAPLRVRVMPGRHGVETADSAGRFRRAGWVDVAAAPRGARFEVPAEPPRTGGITERRRQLHAGIDQPRLRGCTRSIAKAGLTGTYVQVEISVDPRGAVGFLNVLDTDLPSATASCVRDVLAGVRFAPGAAATWRERIDL